MKVYNTFFSGIFFFLYSCHWNTETDYSVNDAIKFNKAIDGSHRNDIVEYDIGKTKKENN